MMRSSLLFTVAAAALAAAGMGCSHNQKVAAAPATPTRVASSRPAPRATPPAPARDALETPRKQDDAIYFDFDSAVLRADATPVLQQVADRARGGDNRLRVEGNCDETGTVEYNLALGDHRARAAKDYLVHLGVPADRIATVSYGSQRPRDPGHDEAAHAKNRRDDLDLVR